MIFQVGLKEKDHTKEKMERILQSGSVMNIMEKEIMIHELREEITIN